MTDLHEVLRAEVERRGQSAVAKQLGYSRSTISLVLAGKYPGRLDLVLEQVRACLGSVMCPFRGQTIPLADCQHVADGPAPTHNRVKMEYWQACRQCQHRQGE